MILAEIFRNFHNISSPNRTQSELRVIVPHCHLVVKLCPDSIEDKTPIVKVARNEAKLMHVSGV